MSKWKKKKKEEPSLDQLDQAIEAAEAIANEAPSGFDETRASRPSKKERSVDPSKNIENHKKFDKFKKRGN